MRFVSKLVIIALLLGLAAPLLADEVAGSVPARSMRISRWVSNLSAGAVLDRRIGIVKSVWWFAVPNIVALGLSFDFVSSNVPLSVGVAVQAPIAVVTPFLCAGAGGSLSGHGITGYGGGFRVRLAPKFGLVFEYRRYHLTQDSPAFPSGHETVDANYVGAGISWRY
ncbi:MAG TPA: hypothetical protein VLJ16_02280 [Acidobacteriota bacterium]|nr:hypothetical protein [Acidobacteriota bacterium]